MGEPAPSRGVGRRLVDVRYRRWVLIFFPSLPRAAVPLDVPRGELRSEAFGHMRAYQVNAVVVGCDLCTHARQLSVFFLRG